jgi:hypothetical protein
MMAQFKIGSKIIINENGKRYGYTKPGSTGIITAYYHENDSYYIMFNKLTGKSDLRGTESYYISTDCVNLLTDLNLTKKDLVIRKIKQMQDKRKENGYVF